MPLFWFLLALFFYHKYLDAMQADQLHCALYLKKNKINILEAHHHCYLLFSESPLFLLGHESLCRLKQGVCADCSRRSQVDVTTDPNHTHVGFTHSRIHLKHWTITIYSINITSDKVNTNKLFHSLYSSILLLCIKYLHLPKKAPF